MIISKTPYRISFFGGGTDYPSWYMKNGGQVISTTINRYVYISCRSLPPFFKTHNLRLAYSKIEEVNKISELNHKSVRSVLNYLDIKKNIEIHYDGDLPARSGMGSSSSFTVGLLSSLLKYKKEKISKKKLAKMAIHIEQKISKEFVGSQDQIAASYGGLNNIKFKKDGNFSVNKINIGIKNLNKLENNLFIFFTGISRTAENIASTYLFNNKDSYIYFRSIDKLTNKAKLFLSEGKINEFGLLLDEAWQIKKKLSKRISNNKIDQIYDCAKKNGALGGKILGAGGGGFLLLYAEKKNHEKLKKSLKKYLNVPFNFSKEGSKIILS